MALLLAMFTPLVAEPMILSTLLEDKLKQNIAQEGATENEQTTDAQAPAAATEDIELLDGFASYNRGRNDANLRDSNFFYGLASFISGYVIPVLSIPLFAIAAPGEMPKHIPDDVVREEYIRGYRDERVRVNRNAAIGGSVAGSLIAGLVFIAYSVALLMQSPD